MNDIRSLFEETKDTNEGFRANCPACGDEKFRLYWNLEKNCGCCFHADCNFAPGKGGVRERELREFLKTPAIYTKVLEKLPEDGEISLPKEFLLIHHLDSSLRNVIFSYFESRGLTRQAIEYGEVGYCETGRFWGYLIFPILDNGEVVYWQARRFKKREPKFYNPAWSKKSELLYVLGNAKRPRRAVIVESVINGLTLLSRPDHPTRWAVCVTLGSSLSDQQIKKLTLYRKSLEDIVIAWDPDAWGKAVDAAKRLSGIFNCVRLAEVPEGEDINSIGRETAWDLINQAEAYNQRAHQRLLARA